MSGPLQRYLDGVSRGEYQSDESQEVALRLLQKLFDEIAATGDSKSPGFFARLAGKKAVAVPARGLYFWGGVGRGKTFLMDLFYEELPIKEKKRLHFHRFMREVHRKAPGLPGRAGPDQKGGRQFCGPGKNHLLR